jgi:hypothetical protein
MNPKALFINIPSYKIDGRPVVGKFTAALKTQSSQVGKSNSFVKQLEI